MLGSGLVLVVNNEAPRLDFGRGFTIRHVFGSTYEQIDLDGTHTRYVVAQPVVYEPTLWAQFVKSMKGRR